MSFPGWIGPALLAGGGLLHTVSDIGAPSAAEKAIHIHEEALSVQLAQMACDTTLSDEQRAAQMNQIALDEVKYRKAHGLDASKPRP